MFIIREGELKLQPSIKVIKLKDGREIRLESNSVLAVVGPNNAGKSHFLRTLVSQLHGATVAEVRTDGGLLSSISLNWAEGGESLEDLTSRARTLFVDGGQGRLQVHNGVQYPGGVVFHEEKILDLVNREDSLGVLADLFVQFDDAVQRIAETELNQLRRPGGHQKQSLVQRARESPEATRLIRHYFKKIFGAEISYYDRGYGEIGFVLGPELVSGSRAGSALTDETKSYMENSPKLWLQGLGMRSVLGLLLRIFAQEQPILVVDEPEAFLHPPQSSVLGSVLREIAIEHNRQLILSTHDRHILQGFTRGDAHGVHIERLDDVGGMRKSVGVPPSALSTARARSLVRFSPLLDALFTKVTILVENETDAFFYSELLEEFVRSTEHRPAGLGSEDCLFLGVGGKAALGRTAELVRSLQSDVFVIADFDVVSNWIDLERVVRGVGLDDPSRINELYNKFLISIDEYALSCSIDRTMALRQLKNVGLNIAETEVRARGTELLESLDEVGVVVCHVGELEDFDASLKESGGKAEWVRLALAANVHRTEEAVKIARRIFRSLGHVGSATGADR